MRFRDAREPAEPSVAPPPPPPPPIATGNDLVSQLVAAASESNNALYQQQLQLLGDAKAFTRGVSESHADLKATDESGSRHISRAGTFEV